MSHNSHLEMERVVRFFLENKQNFHPFRCGRTASPLPNLDGRIYKAHVEGYEPKEYEFPKKNPYIQKIFISACNSTYKKAIRSIPFCNSNDDGFSYNFLLLLSYYCHWF
ncbi:hypothetical protein BDF21DRAFT_395282 [Thamnidium elegans]|nr:hypothetical protein BDF21DRAFT_395282 [Thamnidium elegans]